MSEAAGDIFGPLDFETTDLSQFTTTVSSTANTVSATTTQPAHGSYGMQLDFGGTADLAYGEMTLVPADIMWFRFYIFVPTAFDTGDDFSVMDIVAIQDGGNLVARFGLKTASGNTPNQWNFYYRFAATASATNFSLNAWHYVEIKYVRDAVNGGCEYYVDGDSAGTDSSNDSSAYFPDIYRAGYPRITDTPPSGQVLYFDDMKGNTTQIGAYADVGGTTIPVIVFHNRQQGIL